MGASLKEDDAIGGEGRRNGYRDDGRAWTCVMQFDLSGLG